MKLHTKVLMMASALCMGACGMALSFLPQEILAWNALAQSALSVVLLQALGALYLGFAALNWMARANLIGGIYSRPVALANFLHFAVLAVVLLKAVPGLPVAWLALCLVYCLFAIWFGLVLFTHPLAKTP